MYMRCSLGVYRWMTSGAVHPEPDRGPVPGLEYARWAGQFGGNDELAQKACRALRHAGARRVRPGGSRPSPDPIRALLPGEQREYARQRRGWRRRWRQYVAGEARDRDPAFELSGHRNTGVVAAFKLDLVKPTDHQPPPMSMRSPRPC